MSNPSTFCNILFKVIIISFGFFVSWIDNMSTLEEHKRLKTTKNDLLHQIIRSSLNKYFVNIKSDYISTIFIMCFYYMSVLKLGLL